MSDQQCRHCGKNRFVALDKDGGVGCGCLTAIVLVIGGVCAIAVPPLAAALVAAGLWFGRGAANKDKARVNEYQAQANRLYEQLGRAQVDQALAAYQDGMAALARGDYASALRSFETAWQHGNTSTDVRFGIAVARYNLQQYTEAIPVLEELLRDDAPPEGSRDLLARAYLVVGLEQPERLSFVLSTYERTPGPTRDALTRGLAAHFLASGAATPESAGILGEAVHLEPDSAALAAGLARILLALGRPEEAQTAASRIPPGARTPELLAVHAHALDTLKQSDPDALDVYQGHLTNAPADEAIRIRYSLGLVRQHRTQEAIASYQTGLAAVPESLKLRHQLALTYMMAGETQAAIAELQTIMRSGDFERYLSKAVIHRLLGKCLLQRGLPTAALKQLQMADSDPETLTALYELGELFEARGDGQNARQCFETIYAADVAFRDVATRIG